MCDAGVIYVNPFVIELEVCDAVLTHVVRCTGNEQSNTVILFGNGRSPLCAITSAVSNKKKSFDLWKPPAFERVAVSLSWGSELSHTNRIPFQRCDVHVFWCFHIGSRNAQASQS